MLFFLFLFINLSSIFFNRGQPGSSAGISPFTIGRSNARIYAEGSMDVTFDDVARIDEAKTELLEIVEFLQHGAKYIRLGAKIPKGVLLIGPPGTGKTLLAKAIAKEAKVLFFSISGSEFIEMFVGVGASRVRDLFERAKQQAPAIVFIDELDALGKSRAASGNFMDGNDEREQTLNQLLAEMDGFKPNAGVILLAATNALKFSILLYYVLHRVINKNITKPSSRLEVWLEPCDRKLSRTVLRGGERGDSQTLPDK